MVFVVVIIEDLIVRDYIVRSENDRICASIAVVVVVVMVVVVVVEEMIILNVGV